MRSDPLEARVKAMLHQRSWLPSQAWKSLASLGVMLLAACGNHDDDTSCEPSGCDGGHAGSTASGGGHPGSGGASAGHDGGASATGGTGGESTGGSAGTGGGTDPEAGAGGSSGNGGSF